MENESAPYFSSAERKWLTVNSIPSENILYGEVKTLSNVGKLREFVASKPTLKELREVPTKHGLELQKGQRNVGLGKNSSNHTRLFS